MNTLSEKLYQVIKASIDDQSTAGANVLVLQDGKEIAYAQYGYRDLENKTPMDRDTIFRLYSQTKPVTAAAMMLLVSRGLVDLAGDIAEYLPEFGTPYVNDGNFRMPAKRHIKIKDLLNMTSGLAYPDERTPGGRQSGKIFWEGEQRLFTDHPMTTMEFAHKASQMDLCFEPGSQFQYGISADICGALIEKVTGMRFGEFLQKEFFEPLEMNDTAFYVPADKAHRLAKVYDYAPGGLEERVTNHLCLSYLREEPPAFESGGAGLVSTLDDYSHFATMLLNGGTYKNKEILSKSAVHYLTTNGMSEKLTPYLYQGWDWLSGYTYGNFMRILVNEDTAVMFANKGEYGWDGWLGTFFSNEPQKRLTLLLGVQQVGVGRTGTLVRKLKNVIMN